MKLVFWLTIFLCLTLNSKAQTEFGNNPAAGHYLPTRGIALYYESYGEGPPLLLLHINGGSINVFANQIPFFSSHYHVIAVDSRAHGKSVDPGDSLTFEMMADDFNALLDSLHLDSCEVIGWSDGGISGLLLGIRHPQKVKKLVVSAPNLWPDTTGLEPFIYHWLERSADSLRQLPKTPKSKNDLKIVELDLKEPHMTMQQLHQIRCPVLVIGGDHDAIPTYHLWQIFRNIPESNLWIVPNSGHFVAVYKKDYFNQVVYEFLRTPFRKIEGTGMLH